MTLAEALNVAKTLVPTEYKCRGGCGRVYIVPSTGKKPWDMEPKVYKTAMREVNKVWKAEAKKAGLTFISKAYGIGADALYVGYDNATGYEQAKADMMVAYLKDVAGFACYADAVGD